MGSVEPSADARAIHLVLGDPATLPCGNIGLQTFQRSCFAQNTYGIFHIHNISEKEKERKVLIASGQPVNNGYDGIQVLDIGFERLCVSVSLYFELEIILSAICLRQ